VDKKGVETMMGHRALVISEEAYSHIVEYARFARISPEHAASEAIVRWMKETGEPIMSGFQRRRAERAERSDLLTAN
jgi:hypothetical protein